MPWLRGKWRVTHDPARTIITGSSAGGLASAYLALKRPDLFGNVLSQSGAFWRGNEGSNDAPYEWLTGQYDSLAQQPVRFFLDVGSRESMGAMGGAAPSILEANRRLRDVLRAKGYPIEYFEVPERRARPGDVASALAGPPRGTCDVRSAQPGPVRYEAAAVLCCGFHVWVSSRALTSHA